jgi:inorganic pyrophosphatase
VAQGTLLVTLATWGYGGAMRPRATESLTEEEINDLAVRTVRAIRAEGQLDPHEWRRLDRLIDERGIVIDRPRGEAHPRYPDMIYPCDYGHVPGTAAADGDEIDVFAGCAQTGLVGLIALTHQPSGIADPKLLVNLTQEDADGIIVFLDRGDPGPDLQLFWRQPAR